MSLELDLCFLFFESHLKAVEGRRISYIQMQGRINISRYKVTQMLNLSSFNEISRIIVESDILWHERLEPSLVNFSHRGTLSQKVEV